MPNDRTARQAIRVYLAEHEKTQAWLSQKLRISQSTLSEILSGYRTPSDELLARIHKITGVNLRDFQEVA